MLSVDFGAEELGSSCDEVRVDSAHVPGKAVGTMGKGQEGAESRESRIVAETAHCSELCGVVMLTLKPSDARPRGGGEHLVCPFTPSFRTHQVEADDDQLKGGDVWCFESVRPCHPPPPLESAHRAGSHEQFMDDEEPALQMFVWRPVGRMPAKVSSR